ncbi:MAG: hypothetical protein DKM50_02985 [Candidatus Margulisiibacteriota bacterium]|nr:MAG: hypothetical protein A2X43_09910 [Candidatus Margulisbacteria bacterium GWD2_39_127]OGI04563.1 MAG: hypothetical protein A2X42_07620 [Candidatus Margulisbacteria bacterium GWF2_38_17]OGI11904.1 MAG: hypothetical protein A2X41_11645 [Candidatus Margulisbacteria bacterium GWE2_39_32]PZM83082.1 MAG: hypothetical protein DKM50_02985 [Candidatus Margulisiibacteriota bacterium]HAR62251.1 hypothetical protein [Candidatus Margulisiibacteriota bacterium]
MNNSSNQKAKIITITSGKGGVGKSLFSVNFGIACAKLGKKVLIIDGDLGLANIHILTNTHPEHDLLDILEKRKKIEDVIISGPEGVHIIPGASGIFKLSNTTHAKRQLLIDEFSKLEDRYDFIIIDTEAGISHNVIKFVSISDETIVITTPDITAMADAYATIKVINSKNITSKISIVINRIKSFEEGEATYKKISLVCEKFLSLNVHKLGFVFDDTTTVKLAIKKRIPFILSFPKSKASISIKSITSSFLGLSINTIEPKIFLNKLAMLITHPIKKEELVLKS